MDELIIRVIGGQATPSEEERVLRWRAEAPENEAYFAETLHVWELTEPVRRAAYSTPPAAEVIVEGPQGTGSVLSLGEGRTRRRARRRAVLGTLAMAATVAALAISVQIFQRPGSPSQPIATFAASEGVPRTVSLEDGSIVRLAPGSRLEQWAGGEERRFGLAGRAFFAVSHDPERPFVVEAGAAVTRVLGTRFELSETDGSLRTVVIDGRVALSNERGQVEVPGGSVGSADPGAAPSVRVVDDAYAFLDWPGGLLVFQSTPLAQVAAEVGRQFGQELEVRGDELRALRITAFFAEEGFEEVVESLCDVSGASCSLTDSGALMEDGR